MRRVFSAGAGEAELYRLLAPGRTKGPPEYC